MKLEDFNYNLPKELIAQTPYLKRDEARLLVVGKDKEKEVYFLDEEEHIMDKYAGDEYFEYYKYNLNEKS